MVERVKQADGIYTSGDAGPEPYIFMNSGAGTANFFLFGGGLNLRHQNINI